MDIGNTMKKIRMQKGKSQREFALICGIAQNYLSKIESNLQYPNLATFKKICDRIGIPLPILFLLSIIDEDIPTKGKRKYKSMAPRVERLIKQVEKRYKITGSFNTRA